MGAHHPDGHHGFPVDPLAGLSLVSNLNEIPAPAPVPGQALYHLSGA